MKNIYFDIETIPSQLPWIKQDLRDKIKPPASIKKEETIKKWYDESFEGVFSEKYDKLGLDGAYNHIVCIGVAIDNAEPVTFGCEDVNDETYVLQEFISYLKSNTDNHERRFVGHNIINFDLNVIKKRCFALDIKPDVFPLNAKPWDSNPYDTMTRWDAKNYIKLDELIKVLGLPVSKTVDFDGSKVYQAWLNGEHDVIASYCKDDVIATRAVGRKLMKLEGLI